MLSRISIAKESRHDHAIQTQVQESTHTWREILFQVYRDVCERSHQVHSCWQHIAQHSNRKVSNIVINMHPDVDCMVSNFVVNVLVEKMLLVWKHTNTAPKYKKKKKNYI